MFSLIVTVIAITLVAALALATLFYGGSAFFSNSAKTTTAKLISESQQIEGAVTLFKANSGRYPSDLSELTGSPQYLKAVPPNWIGSGARVSTSPDASISDESCLAYNQSRHGLASIPGCGDPKFAGTSVCCSAAPIFAAP